MACDRFTRELNDHALGAPLGSAAAAHLATCSSCRLRLEEETRLMATIDFAIEQVGSARPAADFQVRVREKASVRIQSWHGRWLPATATVAAAAVLVVIALDVRPSRRAAGAPQDAPPVTVPGKAPAGVPAEAALPLAAAERQSRNPMTRPGTRTVPGRSVRRDAEVLVPTGQPEVIARLLASLSGQEPGVASRLVGRAGTRADVFQSTEAPVSVAPIRIDAVDIPELRAPEPLRTN
jgi:hypothetical protein